MTAFGDLDSAVDSFRYGALEYLTKPFDIRELLSIIDKSISEMAQQPSFSRIELVNGAAFIGEGFATQTLFRSIGRVSSSDVNVVIRGEVGTGKTLVAQAIHGGSFRAKAPLIVMDLETIPEDQIETELFGHEHGSSMGLPGESAEPDIGFLERADGTTLFLDGIEKMPDSVKNKLTVALKAGRFCRTGGTEEVSVDIRLIVSSQQESTQSPLGGKAPIGPSFGLNEITLWVPSLRDRMDDLGLLIDHFLKRAAEQHGVAAKTYHRDVLTVLQHYSWPGNVAQLENLISSLTLLVTAPMISVGDLPGEFISEDYTHQKISWQSLLDSEVKNAIGSGKSSLVKVFSRDVEQILIDAVMRHTNGHRINAAKILGWGRNTLTRKLKSKQIQ
ncbi:MAG: nitrogen regulation protein NR(I) [Gammaproteobacteria bacterium]|nr:nitrogen regulation protein NR(I) [Gammaproteobacteria bacterium]